MNRKVINFWVPKPVINLFLNNLHVGLYDKMFCFLFKKQRDRT